MSTSESLQHILTQEISSLEECYRAFRSWLLDQAFPIWGTIGCDGDKDSPARFGAQEYLTLQGLPAHPPFKRLRVQARQLYSFVQASFLGWEEGRVRADGIYHFMQNAALPGGGWAKTLTPTGEILDKTADLYDIAFVIFSFSWYGRLTKKAEPIEKAQETIRWLYKTMQGQNGGFENTFPVGKESRQQNPHMHLLEAALALYEVTKNPVDLFFAEDLIDLFKMYLFNKKNHTLGEFFEKNWQPCRQQGHLVEPGHHYEWIWLLSEYSRLTRYSMLPYIERLYTFNSKFAIHPETGLIYDSVDNVGHVKKASSRLWVQTEALRAETAVYAFSSFPRDKVQHHIIQLVKALLFRYFHPQYCPAGMWADQLDEHHNPVGDKIPASSFYHIIAGYCELHKLMKDFF
ncbi:AGE family epimerase/isomerase [Entomobacter blattae]|uniref:Cellobiose 2-epimerase n=1 Tax=Entomobacter blattae TaxID=2762277 RepID=A0A7H1NPU7_9PROT|nr:AGE family epimerase/isomerase [Entomobacter blattae]QNT77807.1 Cellobiose 2-epimerase [Entomobacter blattae]